MADGDSSRCHQPSERHTTIGGREELLVRVESKLITLADELGLHPDEELLASPIVACLSLG